MLSTGMVVPSFSVVQSAAVMAMASPIRAAAGSAGVCAPVSVDAPMATVTPVTADRQRSVHRPRWCMGANGNDPLQIAQGNERVQHYAEGLNRRRACGATRGGCGVRLP